MPGYWIKGNGQCRVLVIGQRAGKRANPRADMALGVQNMLTFFVFMQQREVGRKKRVKYQF